MSIFLFVCLFQTLLFKHIALWRTSKIGVWSIPVSCVWLAIANSNTKQFPVLVVGFFQSLVIDSTVKFHCLLFCSRVCDLYWISYRKSSEPSFKRSRGSWIWLGNPKNKTYTNILDVRHKTTASYKNTGTGNSDRIQFPLIPPDVLAMRPSFVLVQCPMSFTLSCSCDKKKFRDEMFPKVQCMHH